MRHGCSFARLLVRGTAPFAVLALALGAPSSASASDVEPSETIKSAIQQKFSRTLRDPDSVLYRWPLWRRERDKAVYCFWANAKNGYGAYTGYKLYGLLLSISEGTLLDVTLVGEGQSEAPTLAYEFCSNFGYDISGPPPSQPAPTSG